MPFAGHRWTFTMSYLQAGKTVSYRAIADEAAAVSALFTRRSCRRRLRRCRVTDG